MQLFSSFNEIYNSGGRVTVGPVGTVMNLDLSGQPDIPSPTSVDEDRSLYSLCHEALDILGILSTGMESMVNSYRYMGGHVSGASRRDSEKPGKKSTKPSYKSRYADPDDLDDDILDDSDFSISDPEAIRKALSQSGEEEDDGYSGDLLDASFGEEEFDIPLSQKELDLASFLDTFREGMKFQDSGKRLYPLLVERVRQIEQKIKEGYENIEEMYRAGKIGGTETTTVKYRTGSINPLHDIQRTLASTWLAQRFFFGDNAFKGVDPVGIVSKVLLAPNKVKGIKTALSKSADLSRVNDLRYKNRIS